jgi:hypothetical protein
LLLTGLAGGVVVWRTGALDRIPEVVDLVMESTGSFGIAMGIWSILLGLLCAWAVTAVGEQGLGRFPPWRLHLTARVVGWSGVFWLVAALVWTMLGIERPRPFKVPVFEGWDFLILASGALAALEGVAASAWLLLLAAVAWARDVRRRGSRVTPSR